MKSLLLALLIGLLPCTLQADLIYTIGNSLTWDATPSSLDGDVDWSIFCSKNLQFIADNPTADCVSTSIPWTTALTATQYDRVVVQPYLGTTLQEDVSVISQWMQMQPNATFVVHTGWASHPVFNAVYNSGNPDDTMRASPEYIGDLIDELENLHPGRNIRSTYANTLLWNIYQDIENNVGPFGEFSELYRDDFHMSTAGKYLIHNSMRLSLDQPISNVGFSISPTVEAYLNSKLVPVPEASSLFFLTFIIFMAAMTRSRKKKCHPSCDCSAAVQPWSRQERVQSFHRTSLVHHFDHRLKQS